MAPKSKAKAKAAAAPALADVAAPPMPIVDAPREDFNAVHFKKIRDMIATILQHDVFTGVHGRQAACNFCRCFYFWARGILHVFHPNFA